ncbi:phage protein NinX family protein [Methylibium petroleiphilum]
MKTAELEGAALDAAVALAEGLTRQGRWWRQPGQPDQDWCEVSHFNPSSRWAVGGPIIDRERITVVRMHRIDEQGERHGAFCAWRLIDDEGDDGAGTYFDVTPDDADGEGPTYLIAAMRCYVASKLGEEVELP